MKPARAQLGPADRVPPAKAKRHPSGFAYVIGTRGKSTERLEGRDVASYAWILWDANTGAPAPGFGPARSTQRRTLADTPSRRVEQVTEHSDPTSVDPCTADMRLDELPQQLGAMLGLLSPGDRGRFWFADAVGDYVMDLELAAIKRHVHKPSPDEAHAAIVEKYGIQLDGEPFLDEQTIAERFGIMKRTLIELRRKKAGPPYYSPTRNHILYLESEVRGWLTHEHRHSGTSVRAHEWARKHRDAARAHLAERGELANRPAPDIRDLNSDTIAAVEACCKDDAARALLWELLDPDDTDDDGNPMTPEQLATRHAANIAAALAGKETP